MGRLTKTRSEMTSCMTISSRQVVLAGLPLSVAKQSGTGSPWVKTLIEPGIYGHKVVIVIKGSSGDLT